MPRQHRPTSTASPTSTATTSPTSPRFTITNPSLYIARMVVFLLVIGGVGWVLFEPLERAFFSNIAINSIILAAFCIGVIFIFRQSLKLLPEYRWIVAMADEARDNGSLPLPSLLATVAVLFKDNRSNMSAQALRSVLDGLAVRLDESREISRYMIGLLVFLGLLGTFWGLLITIQAVSGVVGNIDIDDTSIDTLMRQLQQGLNAPLEGMATAFSSSLFGLGGSLVLGFLDLQLGQASGRFYTDVEDWLSKSARFDDPFGGDSTLLNQGLSEAAADKLHEFARSIAKTENERRDLAESIRNLTTQLSKLAELRANDALLAENIANLDAALTNLAREMRGDRAELNTTITMELRALSKAVIKAIKN